MKRILALFAVSALLVTSFVGCSKKEKQNNDITPTGSVSNTDSSSQDNMETTMETIMFGGNYENDNARLSFNIFDGAWNVSGYSLTNGSASPLVLGGAITAKELPVFMFTEDDNELEFTFAKDSVTVKVNKGTKYADFAGSYKRTSSSSGNTGIVSPEHGSSLEFLGRVALAHYIVGAADSPEIGIDLSASTFDTAYMEKVVLAYTDMFLILQAKPLPEMFEKYLCYSYTEDEFNRLLQTASFGNFTVDNFDLTKSVFKCNDGIYYVPCYGTNAGGLSLPETNQELISDALLMSGVVSKATGERLNVEMTLTTVKSTKEGTPEVLLESINYKNIP